MKPLKTLIIAAFFIFSCSAKAYVVRNIIVKIDGQNAVTARQMAVLEGQKNAFKTLVARIAPGNHKEIIPSDDDLLFLVESYEINSEKISPENYKAVFKISFNKKNVNEFLQNREVQLSKSKIPQVLVIPIFNSHGVEEEFGNFSTWGETPWFESWSSVLHDFGADSEFLLPVGNATDSELLEEINPMMAPESAYAKILREYDANSAIIAQISFFFEENKKKMILNVRNVRNSRHSYEKIFDLEGKEKIRPIFENAIHEIIENHLTTPHKHHIGMNKIHLMFLHESLKEWIDLEKQISSNEGVKNVVLVTVNNKSTRFQVEYHGDAQEFFSNLAKIGLQVRENSENPGEFIISKIKIEEE